MTNRLTSARSTLRSRRGPPRICRRDARGRGRADGVAACRRQAGRPCAPYRGDGPAPGGRADHGHRVDQEPAGDLLRRRRLDPACAGLNRHDRTRDASGGVRRHREEQGSPFEPLRRCLDAEHAAHHLERHRAARRSVARPRGLARLRAHALRFRRQGVRQGADGVAGDHLANRHRAGRVFRSGAVRTKQDAIDAIPARAAALAGDADEAAKAAAAAKAAVASAKRAAAAAPAMVRNLASLKARADAELAHAGKMFAAVNADPRKTDQAKAAAEDAKQKAAAKADGLGPQLDAARADLKAKQDALAAAEAAAKAAEAKRVETARRRRRRSSRTSRSRSSSAARRRSFTCGATPTRSGRTAATVRLQRGVPGHDQKSRQAARHAHLHRGGARRGRLRWTEVSIDNGDTARNALDRITFPQEVLDRIAPTARPLSSITISDKPLSSETNYRTEFVVVLNNPPRGLRQSFALADAHRARSG